MFSDPKIGINEGWDVKVREEVDYKFRNLVFEDEN